jgi:hypothetical protein
MRKRLIPLIALLMILAIVAVAYSVAIDLSEEPPDLGATDYVNVVCPTPKGDVCQIDSIKWIISSLPPRNVTGVKIDWNPGSADGYDVFVELYGEHDKYVGGGSVTDTKDNPLTVNFDPSVDPKDIYKIRIVIIETGGYETS